MTISIPTTNHFRTPFGIIAGVINPSEFATPSPTNIHCGTAEQILARVRTNKAEETRHTHSDDTPSQDIDPDLLRFWDTVCAFAVNRPEIRDCLRRFIIPFQTHPWDKLGNLHQVEDSVAVDFDRIYQIYVEECRKFSISPEITKSGFRQLSFGLSCILPFNRSDPKQYHVIHPEDRAIPVWIFRSKLTPVRLASIFSELLEDNPSDPIKKPGKAFTPKETLRAISNLLEEDRPGRIEPITETIRALIGRTDMD